MLGFHTLDARDSVLLPWLYTQVADSNPEVFQSLMQKEATTIRELLRSRDVNYDTLKSALQPTDRGRKIVFLYDWWEDESTNYAVKSATNSHAATSTTFSTPPTERQSLR